jgi:hypothetical protein
LLIPLAGPVPPRTVREYVAGVRQQLFMPEAFVHRTHRPGETVEADFGESWAVVAGKLCKVKCTSSSNSGPERLLAKRRFSVSS